MFGVFFYIKRKRNVYLKFEFSENDLLYFKSFFPRKYKFLRKSVEEIVFLNFYQIFLITFLFPLPLYGLFQTVYFRKRVFTHNKCTSKNFAFLAKFFKNLFCVILSFWGLIWKFLRSNSFGYIFYSFTPGYFRSLF